MVKDLFVRGVCLAERGLKCRNHTFWLHLLITQFSFFFFRCRTLLLVGDSSPHIEEAEEMNGRMLPEETDFMKASHNANNSFTREASLCGSQNLLKD